MRDYRLYIEDILEAIERIEEYTWGMTLEEFRINKMAVDAVVRNLRDNRRGVQGNPFRNPRETPRDRVAQDNRTEEHTNPPVLRD